MIGSDLRAFEVRADGEWLGVSYRRVEGQPFVEALRLEVKRAVKNPWDIQLQAKTLQPIEKGDVLLATFQFRSEWSREESGEGQTEFVFELGRSPFTKSVSHAVRAAREWRQISVPFTAADSYAAGEAHLNFRLGFAPQTVELANVELRNFKREVALADLPRTQITYGGMQTDAAWRATAAARIEQLRKAELRILVKDRAGRPLAGVPVQVRQTRQAFGFGTCVPAASLLGSGADDEKIRRITSELFNVATLENDLKWTALAGDWGPDFTLPRAKAGVAWLRARGLDVRGHVLVWPGWRNLPKSLRALEREPAQLRAEVKRHVRELASTMKGSLVHWDVVNEPFDNHDLLDLFGPEVMLEWFKEARAAEPAAKLFINDYAILSGGGGTTPHRDGYESAIRVLVDGGAPLDGIGMQGHFGSSLTAPEDLLAILDRFAKFEKQIVVTEYDIVLDDEELAGRYTRDFYTTLFSHPAVSGIVMWGFWDGAHWKKNAPMYRADWSEKPAGQAIRELLTKTWRTEAGGHTDASGAFSVRGFHGDYALTAGSGGAQKAATAVLRAEGSQVSLVLD